jgi:hypothetical protein
MKMPTPLVILLSLIYSIQGTCHYRWSTPPVGEKSQPNLMIFPFNDILQRGSIRIRLIAQKTTKEMPIPAAQQEIKVKHLKIKDLIIGIILDADKANQSYFFMPKTARGS